LPQVLYVSGVCQHGLKQWLDKTGPWQCVRKLLQGHRFPIIYELYNKFPSQNIHWGSVHKLFPGLNQSVMKKNFADPWLKRWWNSCRKMFAPSQITKCNKGEFLSYACI